MEQVFEVGKKYAKEDILAQYRDFDEIDFTHKNDKGTPILRVRTGGKKTMMFIKDGKKYRLFGLGQEP